MDEVRQFFADFESALVDSDVERIGACYADVFLFGGPQGTQSVRKEDFLKVIPRRKEYFASLGLKSTKLDSLVATEMDSKYTFVKTTWDMCFDRGGEVVHSQNAASYILARTNGRFGIVVQIDHQDLTERAKQLNHR